MYVLNATGIGNGSYNVQRPLAVRPALHLNINLVTEGMTDNVNLDRQDGSNTVDTMPVWFNEIMPAITPPMRSGYMFGGYYTGKNGTGEQYYLPDGTSQRTFTASSPTTLYAKWITTYMVTFEYNGATVGDLPISKTVTFDSTYGELPEPSQPGGIFEGWYLDSTFTTPVTSTTKVTTARDHTLYARWFVWL